MDRSAIKGGLRVNPRPHASSDRCGRAWLGRLLADAAEPAVGPIRARLGGTPRGRIGGQVVATDLRARAALAAGRCEHGRRRSIGARGCTGILGRDERRGSGPMRAAMKPLQTSRPRRWSAPIRPPRWGRLCRHPAWSRRIAGRPLELCGSPGGRSRGDSADGSGSGKPPPATARVRRDLPATGMQPHNGSPRRPAARRGRRRTRVECPVGMGHLRRGGRSAVLAEDEADER